MTRHTKFMNQARKTMGLSVVQDAQLHNILDAAFAEYDAEIRPLEAEVKILKSEMLALKSEIRLLKAKQPKPQTAEQ